MKDLRYSGGHKQIRCQQQKQQQQHFCHVCHVLTTSNTNSDHISTSEHSDIHAVCDDSKCAHQHTHVTMNSLVSNAEPHQAIVAILCRYWRLLWWRHHIRVPVGYRMRCSVRDGGHDRHTSWCRHGALHSSVKSTIIDSQLCLLCFFSISQSIITKGMHGTIHMQLLSSYSSQMFYSPHKINQPTAT